MYCTYVALSSSFTAPCGALQWPLIHPLTHIHSHTFCSGVSSCFLESYATSYSAGMQLYTLLEVIFLHCSIACCGRSLMNDWTPGPLFNVTHWTQRGWFKRKVKPTMSWGLCGQTGDALHNVICTKPSLWVTVPTLHPTEQHNDTLSIPPFCPSGTHADQLLLKCKAVNNWVTRAQSVKKRSGSVAM